MPGVKEYVDSGGPKLIAPPIPKRRGRPPKAWKKTADEGAGTSTRVGLTVKCCKCGGLGYNSRGCTDEPVTSTQGNNNSGATGTTAVEATTNEPSKIQDNATAPIGRSAGVQRWESNKA